MKPRIRVSDPLQLLPYQTGVIFTTRTKKAGEGDTSSKLDVQQRAVQLGTPVPIVFGKYVDQPGTDPDHGGIFISPGATKVRYEIDEVTNELTLKICLVLSEGYLPQPKVQDIYQRTCRRGSAVWAYDKLAGPYFAPGTFTKNGGTITITWNGPSYTGSDAGTYEDLTTLYYRNDFAAGDDTYTKQIHVFIREGIHVPRMIPGTVGSSNNMIDLALYLIRKTSRVPELLIDLTQMFIAANYVQANGFTWDGVVDEGANLEDWMQEMAGYFLLRVGDKNGKKGFRPLLPYSGLTYLISTNPVSWVFGFTEEHIVPDSFQIEYINLEDRKPICAQMIWRQQPPYDVGFIRTTEVRIDGEAPDGPYEQYDMSQFCTREDHAVKVGAYQLARRKYVTHALRIKVKPDSFNTTLVLGNIVRVQLRRETEPGVVSFHDYLYEVEKINKTASGAVELDLMHFPIDALGRSILALYVAGAEGTGYLYDIDRNEYTCDNEDNVDDDTPVDPTDPGDGNNPEEPDTDVDLPAPDVLDPNDPTPPTDRPVFPGGTPTTNYPPSGSTTGNNASDPFDTDEPGGGATGTGPWGTSRPPLQGDTWTIRIPCCPGRIYIYAVDCAAFENEAYTFTELQEQGLLLSEATVMPDPLGCEFNFTVLSEHAGYCLFSVYRCGDPGSPDGWGSPQLGPTTPRVGGGCSGGLIQGGYGTFSQTFDIGEGLGTFQFYWFSGTGMADQFIISGAASYDTGLAFGQGTVTVTKTSASRYITVTVNAPIPGTQWRYSVGCTEAS